MKNEIINTISNTLEIDRSKINENTNLSKDLNIDSLDLLDLVVAFENKYNLKINDQDIKNLQTVKDIIMYIEKSDV